MSGILKDIDKGWSRIVKELKEINKSVVKVGILESAGNTTDGKMRMAKLGSIQEYGLPQKKIPPRPFMRQAYERCKEKIIQLLKSEKSKIILGKSNVKKSLDVVGTYFQQEIQREFTAGNFVPNKPETIRRKGSSQPLIDTGRLKGSIRFLVEKE